MKLFITRPIPEKALQRLEEKQLDITIFENGELTDEEFVKNAKQNDLILSSGHHHFDAHFFQECNHLVGIALMSVGFDHVDIKAAQKHNIPVSNTPDVLTDATADIAFLLMLATSRNAFFFYRAIKDDMWDSNLVFDHLGIELYGKTLGIFGLGRIGYHLAKKAKNYFGMNVIYHNRSPKPEYESDLEAKRVSFDELLKQSDVVSVHSNLTSETEGKFDASAFHKMKKNAIFINTARGAIHNERDLINALKSKTIWGAGLDVSNPEPMQPDNELLRLPQVSILPHIGSATEETKLKMAHIAVDNILAVVEGIKMPQQIETR